jgi:hypothetical protein
VFCRALCQGAVLAELSKVCPRSSASALPALLAQIAVLAAGVGSASGCSSSSASVPCSGPFPPPRSVSISSAVACSIVEGAHLATSQSFTDDVPLSGCDAACGPSYSNCMVPAAYVNAFLASCVAQYCGGSGSSRCPSVTGPVTIQCTTICEGRRTDGIGEPAARGRLSAGNYLATCSYLEAVSVHAFARLRAELTVHGAPRELLAAVHRAQRDEVRHARLMRALARGYGIEPEQPAPPPRTLRSAYEIARENAVEGCVRETYGAVVASIRATRATDPRVRAAMQSIARDEREHAALSWRIGAWLVPRLAPHEQRAVALAMRDAVAELTVGGGDGMTDAECRTACGLPSGEQHLRMVALLDAAVFRTVA